MYRIYKNILHDALEYFEDTNDHEGQRLVDFLLHCGDGIQHSIRADVVSNVLQKLRTMVHPNQFMDIEKMLVFYVDHGMSLNRIINLEVS